MVGLRLVFKFILIAKKVLIPFGKVSQNSADFENGVGLVWRQG